MKFHQKNLRFGVAVYNVYSYLKLKELRTSVVILVRRVIYIVNL